MPLLTVKNLNLTDTKTQKQILKDVSFELYPHDFLGIVGESGSGKSMTMGAIMQVNPSWIETSGEIFLAGELLNKTSIQEIRGKKITMVLQDGMTAFNPLRKIGKQMLETFRRVLGVSKTEAYRLSMDCLEKLNFKQPQTVLEKYPHELSGGMLQRCMMAIALVMKPQIIIADEPTTALDSISQMEVVKEMERIRDEYAISFILVSHDLGVVQRLANRVLVMKDGEVVETGTTQQIFNQPQHPYTQYLVETRLELSAAFKNSGGKEPA